MLGMLCSDSEEFDVILAFDTGNTITQLHLMSNYCDKELKKLMTLESVDYGIQQSTLECIPSSSPNQNIKVKIKFLIASRWKVREYNVEFWLPPSTTLADACTVTNRQFFNILRSSNDDSCRKLARELKSITCDVVFIRPRVLAGDLNQTIGEVVTDQFLCFSNSIDCFRIQENSESVLAFQVVGGIIGICLAILILAVACA